MSFKFNPFTKKLDLVGSSSLVPYTGATDDLDLGTHDLTVNNITGSDASDMEIQAKSATTGNTSGAVLYVLGGSGYGSGSGGNFSLVAGDGGATGGGGAALFTAGNGGASGGSGGGVEFTAGAAQAGNNDGGYISFCVGSKSGSGTAGNYRFYESTMTTYSVLDFDSTTETRTYAFPDASGTVALEERALAYSIVL